MLLTHRLPNGVEQMADLSNKAVRNDLDEHSFLEYYESYFDATTADELFNELTRDDFPWERQTIRGVLTRRANAWFANDQRFVYRYTGQTWLPNPFTPAIFTICDRLEELCQCGLNCALGALYPDGQAAVSWHDDNDFPSFPDTPIATVSFGSERRFKIRRKSDHEVVAQYDIAHGSVVIMGGALQRYYDHAIQKTSKKVGPRVNLSYRTFRDPE